MEVLTLVVPKTFPTSGPIRIQVSVDGSLLQYFDDSLPSTLTERDFMGRLRHSISRQIARLAINTCLGTDVEVPKIQEGFVSHPASENWHYLIQVDCSVPPDEKDPQVIYFHSNTELDDDGNVEFIPIVPRTANARRKYHRMFDFDGEMSRELKH